VAETLSVGWEDAEGRIAGVNFTNFFEQHFFADIY
jgi:hypothetical protein